MEEHDTLPEQFTKPFAKLCYLLDRSGVCLLRKNRGSPASSHWRFLYIVPASLTFIVSLTTYLVRVVGRMEDLIEISNSMSVMFVVIQALAKATTVTYYKEDLILLIEQLGKLWPTDEHLTETQTAAKNKNLRALNICINVYFWMTMVGTWQYLLVPVAETLARALLQQETELRYPFGCAFPFEPRLSWNRYLATYFFECFGIIHLVYFLVGAELLMITLTAHLSTLFTLLSIQVLALEPSNDIRPSDSQFEGYSYANGLRGGVRRNQINNVVKRHQILIKLSRKIDDIFNKVIFANVTSSTVSICFFGFVAKVPSGRSAGSRCKAKQIFRILMIACLLPKGTLKGSKLIKTAKKTSDVANNLIGVVASILPIFNLCYYGQLLTDASRSVSDSVYYHAWYEGAATYQKTLCLIMFRSQNACYISSLNYTPVTLAMFTTVMSTTWSYFSLVISVYDEDE